MLKLLFFTVQLLTLAIAQSCYFPDGSQAAESDQVRPCNPGSSEHSACCVKTALCMSNGLCMQQSTWGNRLARSACTDSTWNSPACPQICTRTRRDNALTLYLAIENKDGLGYFCCGSHYDGSTGKCNGTNDAGEYYTPTALTGAQVLLPNSTTPVGDLEQASTTSASATTTTTTAAATTTNFPITCPNSGSDESSGSNDVAIGAGVGVSLGAAFLIASALFFWQWRKNKNLSRQLSQFQAGHLPPEQSQTYSNGLYSQAELASCGGSPMSAPAQKYMAPNHELAAERPMSELPSRI